MFCFNPDWIRSIELDKENMTAAIDIYRSMYLIRHVQFKIESIYHLDEMKTPVHLYVGQEAIASGVCQALQKTDNVFSNHRSHGHYLAKGGNLVSMIAELYCRTGGCAKGRGGSMHLIDTSVGLMGASSIVGGGIPLAVGAALTSQLQSDRKVSVAFFGDGAADEGVLYESVNFAVLRKLPVVFVCENNFYAVCSPVSNRQESTGSITKRFSGMGLPSVTIDGTNAVQVFEAAQEAVSRARAGEGPTFMECIAYRWRGHSGAGSDTALGYRTQAELELWMQHCPIERLKNVLLKQGDTVEAALYEIEKSIVLEVEKAFVAAKESPLPGPEDVCDRLCLAGGE